MVNSLDILNRTYTGELTMKFNGNRFSKRSGTCIWFVYQTLIQWGFNPPRLDPHPSSVFNKKEFTNEDFAIMHKCISSYLNKLELVEHAPYKKKLVNIPMWEFSLEIPDCILCTCLENGAFDTTAP
jgi:hypothetical protein